MNNIKPSIILLDVDGVLAAAKYYNFSGECVYKTFHDRDFTSIKGFKALGIPVIFLTGDKFNQNIADIRNIPFYLSRFDNGIIDKSWILDLLRKHYNKNITENLVYLADDIFDLSLLKASKWAFCPSDSSSIVKKECTVLKNKSGDGLVCEMLDWFIEKKILPEPSIEEIIKIDAFEYNGIGKYCVYKISNNITGQVYIGQTINAEKRWYQHQVAVKNNKTDCPKLYSSMKKYGIENFKFEILETGNSENWSLRKETEYIEFFNSYYDGFNCIKDTIGRNCAMRDPILKAKILESMRSAANRTKMKNRMSGSKNHMYGKHHSTNTKKQISSSKKRNGLSAGNKNPRAIYDYIIISPNGEKYTTDCLSSFCREHNLNRRSMAGVAEGKQSHYKKWIVSKSLQKNKKLIKIKIKKSK